ncbi:MAG: glycosyltransferase [Moraxellaceae bacterium]|nr:glycosyltransferase [Azonexus sp.]MBP8851964.1 glycosyltransferase [Moraxellaceae bacterium]
MVGGISSAKASESPVITVVITVYKRTNYLCEALQSVLAQSYRSFEIVVTDDSCSDAVKGIVNQFNSPLIRYRGNPSTLGVALNLRAAVKEARGRYVAILNDDDVWEPDFLAELVTPLEQNKNISLAFSDHWIISGKGELDVKATDENTARYRNQLPSGVITNPTALVLEKNGVPLAMASLIRKDTIDWDLLVSHVSGAYDFWISCLLAATGRPFYFVPKRLTRYRVHDAMETARRAPDKNTNMAYIYAQLLEMNHFDGREEFLKSRLAQALFQVGKDNLYFNNLGSARGCFARSMKAKPSLKVFLALLLSYSPHQVRSWLRLSSNNDFPSSPTC